MFKAFKNTMIDIALESVIFGLASDQVEGYEGGMWQMGQTVRGMDFVGLPEADSVRVQSAMNFCDVTTDPITAGAALTVVAFNHFGWKMYRENPDAADTRKLFDLGNDLKFAVLESDWDDDRKSAFLEIID